MIGKLAKIAALIFFAAPLAHAETNGSGAVSCSGVGAEAPADYAPPFISNGSIATTIDNLGGQGAGKFCGIISDVAWAARRYSLPERDLFSFGHYGCEISVGGESLGEPLKWTQTLDTSRGFVRTRVEYKTANVITTAFILQGSDILAVEKLVELKGASPAEKVDIKFSYSLAEKNSEETRPRMAASASAENGSAKISYTAYGYAVYSGEISVASGVPAKASAKKNSVELSASLPVKNGASRAAFFVCYSDDFGGRKISETSEKLKKTASRGFAELLEENSRAWLSKRTKSFVKIPDAKITEVFETSLYFLRALRTNWSYPISLFTHGQHWNGAYFTWDEAFITAGLCAFGDFPHSRLAPDFRRAIFPAARKRVSHKSGDFGIFYELSTREDGSTASPQPFGFWANHIFQNAAVASYCYWHWLFTHDKKYLEKVYPVIKGCAQYYYMASLSYDERGRLVVGKTLDLERLGPSCPNPFMTACGIIYNFEIAAKCADILGVDAGYAKRFRKAAAELRKNLPNDGEKYVPRPDKNDKSIACIGGLFPFMIFDGSDKMQSRAAYDFAENITSVGNMYPTGKDVCTWYYTWAASALVKLGDPKIPFDYISKAAKNSGYFGEMWEIREDAVKMRPWFSTAAGNFIHSVCAMLVSCREGGEIKIASAVPEHWKGFSFCLPVYGGNFVSAKFSGGKLEKLELRRGEFGADGARASVAIPKRFMDNPPKGWTERGGFWVAEVAVPYAYAR